MVGIYKITSPSGRIYIGQSWNIKERIRGYKKASFIIRKERQQPVLVASFNKYGAKNHLFEICHELPPDVSQEVLDTYEIFYWQQYIYCGFNMMNVKEPGLGGKLAQSTKDKISISHTGKKLSEEHKKKLSAFFKGRKNPLSAHKGEKNPFYGKRHSDETMAKIKESKKGKQSGENNPFYGKKHSAETIKKQSDIKKGKPCPEYTKLRSSQAHKGKPKSEEARKKLSASLMGHKSWNKGMKLYNRRRRPVISYSFGHLN